MMSCYWTTLILYRIWELPFAEVEKEQCRKEVKFPTTTKNSFGMSTLQQETLQILWIMG